MLEGDAQVSVHDVRTGRMNGEMFIFNQTDQKTGEFTVHVILADKDPWLLSLLGDKAYSLGVGDIMHHLKFLPGIKGKVERQVENFGRSLGLNVMGNADDGILEDKSRQATRGKTVIFDWMKRQKALRYGAYALFLGHREALVEAQKEENHGLELFSRALNNWKFSDNRAQIAALAVLYDLMPDDNNLRQNARQMLSDDKKVQRAFLIFQLIRLFHYSLNHPTDYLLKRSFWELPLHQSNCQKRFLLN